MEQCESKIWTYELLDWINKEELCWAGLSANPNAIQMLERNPEKINWTYLSSNPNAIHLLEKNIVEIRWFCFASNPNAINY